MSRINIRYYKKHPPRKERELSLAAYIVWHGMSTEQQDDFKKWAKKLNKAKLDFTEDVHAALVPHVEKIGQIRMLWNHTAP